MYIPNQFNITDKKEIFTFIKENSFGQLISLVEGKLFSTHIPFLISEDKRSIICHIAKNNPQWKDIEEQEILVTFQGPHDYVSPSWYASPGVPTWNYQAVHIYGTANVITEQGEIKNIVSELTSSYESDFDKPYEPVFNEAMLNAIIAIEINITDIQAKYKLSQNRPETDRLKVSNEHNKRGSAQLSKATIKEM